MSCREWPLFACCVLRVLLAEIMLQTTPSIVLAPHMSSTVQHLPVAAQGDGPCVASGANFRSDASSSAQVHNVDSVLIDLSIRLSP